MRQSPAPSRLPALAVLLWTAAFPVSAQEPDAEPGDFTQPGHSTTIQGPGIDPIPLNRADSDRLAVGLAGKYLKEGKFAEAVEILAALHRRRPWDNGIGGLLTRAEAEWSRRLMAVGNYAGAMEVLSAAERRRPKQRDNQILLAQTEVALGRPRDAIARLETLTLLHPDWPRPRVELALAHAAAGNIRKAKAILVAELGKDPPPHVRRNIENAIRLLEDRQALVGRFSVGVVPDSNASGGTYNDTVEFLGLPFTLNDDAKQQSGVRAEISAGGTARTKWNEGVRLELGIDVSHAEPLGDQGTPSSNAKATIAARIRRPKGNMRAGFGVQPVYFDNELHRIERSLFMETGRRVTDKVSAVSNLVLTEGDFADDPTRDFHQWETSIGPSFAIGSGTRLQFNGIFGARNAEAEVNSYLRRGVSANLVTSPADGWRLSLAGALTRDVYREENLAFGTTQEDLIAAANMQVVKTGFVLFGLSPSFGLGYSEVRSTIDLFDKRSYTVQLGVALPY